MGGKKPGSPLANFNRPHMEFLNIVTYYVRLTVLPGQLARKEEQGAIWCDYPTAENGQCLCLSREPGTILTARLQHSWQKNPLTTKLEIVLPADPSSSPSKTWHLSEPSAGSEQARRQSHSSFWLPWKARKESGRRVAPTGLGMQQSREENLPTRTLWSCDLPKASFSSWSVSVSHYTADRWWAD